VSLVLWLGPFCQPDILFVNRQIRREAIPFFLRLNSFRLRIQSDPSLELSPYLAPMFSNNLRSLTLSPGSNMLPELSINVKPSCSSVNLRLDFDEVCHAPLVSVETFALYFGHFIAIVTEQGKFGINEVAELTAYAFEWACWLHRQSRYSTQEKYPKEDEEILSKGKAATSRVTGRGYISAIPSKWWFKFTVKVQEPAEGVKKELLETKEVTAEN
jgi:hypothetical protein